MEIKRRRGSEMEGTSRLGRRTGILVLLLRFVAGVICYPVSACTTIWIKRLTANLPVHTDVRTDPDPTSLDITMEHVKLELGAVAGTLDIVGMVLHHGDLAAQRFDSALRITKLLRDGEDLGALERALGAFIISGPQSVGVEGL